MVPNDEDYVHRLFQIAQPRQPPNQCSQRPVRRNVSPHSRHIPGRLETRGYQIATAADTKHLWLCTESFPIFG
jgi:hypothetical protein